MLNVREAWLSMPMRIRFAGWESNTYQLQQQGWKLSARESATELSLQLALHHPDTGLYMVTNKLDVDYFALHHHDSAIDALRGAMLHVQHAGVADQFRIIQWGGSACDFNFKPIDALPQLVMRERNIGELNIFAPAQLVRTEEVIVMPDSVPELMAHILELQAPGQKEIRDRARQRAMRDKLPEGLGRLRQNFHAQIITIGEDGT